jgi:cation diffusion facilitator family transporter
MTSSPEHPDSPPQGADQGGESLTTVLLALGANAGVAVLKLAAGLITGSGALLSEAAHSAGDTTTELFLLAAVKRSDKPADRRHPFGYGKERFFWSMLAAIAIFVSGAAFSIYEGITTILHGEDGDRLWINYIVLALAAVLEGISLRQGIKQVRGAARVRRRTAREYLTRPDDPTVKSVVLEDSAAIVGLILAALGVGLHQLTGSSVWDGIASICIGVLLIVASFLLGNTSKDLLIGEQADRRVVLAIEEHLEAQDEVLDVVDLLTMTVGARQILLCARVDFRDQFSASDLENACVRIGHSLRERFPALQEIFIEPVPRTDKELRQRVLNRYGRVLADDVH